MGAGSEFVTLGEDPYSDYSLSVTPSILQYPLGARGRIPAAEALPGLEEHAGFSDVYDDMGAVPSELTQALAAGVFDAGDPCDPYF